MVISPVKHANAVIRVALLAMPRKGYGWPKGRRLVAAFVLPKANNQPKGAATMNKLSSVLNWCKKHKIITAIIILFIAIGTIANSNSTKPTTTASTTTQKTATTTSKSTQTQQTTPSVSCKITEDKTTNVGVLIPTSDDNVNTMKQLGQTLKNDYGSRSQVTVFVFDSQDAANLLDTVLQFKDTAAQDAVYDPHFIAEYSRNSSSGLNRFTIQLNGGDKDPNPTEINY